MITILHKRCLWCLWQISRLRFCWTQSSVNFGELYRANVLCSQTTDERGKSDWQRWELVQVLFQIILVLSHIWYHSCIKTHILHCFKSESEWNAARARRAWAALCHKSSIKYSLISSTLNSDHAMLGRHWRPWRDGEEHEKMRWNQAALKSNSFPGSYDLRPCQAKCKTNIPQKLIGWMNM